MSLSLDIVTGFWEKHKNWLPKTLGCLALVALGYGFGRYAQPAKVVTTEKVVTVEKQVVVTQIKTEVQIAKVYLKNSDEKIHRVTTETKKPDGSDVKTVSEDINIDSVVHENNTQTEIKYVDKIVEKEVVKTVDKEKLVYRDSANWRLGANVGYSIPHLLDNAGVGVAGLNGLVLGAQVDRKVLGPIYLGVFGNTQGTVGLAVSAGF